MSTLLVGRLDLKPGDVVRVIANRSGYNPSRVGMTYTLSAVLTGIGNQATYVTTDNQYFYPDDLECFKLTRSTIEANIKDLNSKIAELKSRLKDEKLLIEYLDESGADEIDTTEFKVYHTLTLIENGKMNKREKAQAIAALLD